MSNSELKIFKPLTGKGGVRYKTSTTDISLNVAAMSYENDSGLHLKHVGYDSSILIK